MGWPGTIPAAADPRTALVDWAQELADMGEGVLDVELRMEFRDVPPSPFEALPSEVVVEWNHTLPDEAFAEPPQRA